ncbi:MAG: hypothetical protein DMF84_09650 [Acidobacteria bacterium]|nr:MAG: hypothetical protein DMF84_09650 [Acidobacteriota bacterium]
MLLPTATVQKLDALKRGTYRAIGDRAYGETQGAAIEAEKAAARGARQAIESVEPTVGPIHQAESKLIDASGVLDDAVFRSGKHNPFGLTEGIALAGHRPIWALPALLNRPGIGSPVARAVNAVGRKLATAEPPANLVRAALLALMGQDQEPEQPEQR